MVPGRLIYYHYWCWRVRGAAPVKTSTGHNFPWEYQRNPRNSYQYWCQILVTFPDQCLRTLFQGNSCLFPVWWPPLNTSPQPTPWRWHFLWHDVGQGGASHEKFVAAPSKKQARFLEGPVPLRIKGKATFLEAPFASKKVLRGTFRGLPPFAPLLSGKRREVLRPQERECLRKKGASGERKKRTKKGHTTSGQFLPFTDIFLIRSRPGKPNQRKGPKRKVHEFRPFLWILVFFLRKTSTIHIELLFRNAPAKSSWTHLSLVWFARATPDLRRLSQKLGSQHQLHTKTPTVAISLIGSAPGANSASLRGFFHWNADDMLALHLRPSQARVDPPTAEIALLYPDILNPAKCSPQTATQQNTTQDNPPKSS